MHSLWRGGRAGLAGSAATAFLRCCPGSGARNLRGTKIAALRASLLDSAAVWHGRSSASAVVPEVSAQQRVSERPAVSLHCLSTTCGVVQSRQIWLRDCTGTDLLGKVGKAALHMSARLPWHAGEGDHQSFPRGRPGAGLLRGSRLIMTHCSLAVSKLGDVVYKRPCSATRA